MGHDGAHTLRGLPAPQRTLGVCAFPGACSLAWASGGPLLWPHHCHHFLGPPPNLPPPPTAAPPQPGSWGDGATSWLRSWLCRSGWSSGGLCLRDMSEPCRRKDVGHWLGRRTGRRCCWKPWPPLPCGCTRSRRGSRSPPSPWVPKEHRDDAPRPACSGRPPGRWGGGRGVSRDHTPDAQERLLSRGRGPRLHGCRNWGPARVLLCGEPGLHRLGCPPSVAPGEEGLTGEGRWGPLCCAHRARQQGEGLSARIPPCGQVPKALEPRAHPLAHCGSCPARVPAPQVRGPHTRSRVPGKQNPALGVIDEEGSTGRDPDPETRGIRGPRGDPRDTQVPQGPWSTCQAQQDSGTP